MTYDYLNNYMYVLILIIFVFRFALKSEEQGSEFVIKMFFAIFVFTVEHKIL